MGEEPPGKGEGKREEGEGRGEEGREEEGTEGEGRDGKGKKGGGLSLRTKILATALSWTVYDHLQCARHSTGP